MRVLDCTGSGSTPGVIAGVDWVTQNHVKPAVANMSLGGGVSTALDQAVANSIAAGVSYAIAAGNSNANACNSSPARVASANTVGATTNTDARSSFSNFGTCVDIFAPGSSITSSWYTCDTATNTISGTSMATPHVDRGARALPADEPDRLAGHGDAGADRQHDAEQGHESGHGLAEPPAVLPVRRRQPAGTRPRRRRRITSPASGATVSGTITVAATQRQRRRQPRRALRRRLAGRHGHDLALPDRLEHDDGVNGAHSLQTRAYDAAGNVGSSAAVGVTVANASSGGELIVNGGFEGSASPWTLSGSAFWSTGGNHHSGTGYSILGAGNNASGSEYQTVTIPAGHPANLTFWLNITTSESLTTAYDFVYVEVTEHVRRAARHARQLQQPQRRVRRQLVHAAVVQPRARGEARPSGSSSGARRT